MKQSIKFEEKNNPTLYAKEQKVYLAKNLENLTFNQKKALKPLKDLRLKTMKAYSIKFALRDFWIYKYRKSAESYLNRWYFS